MFLFILFVLMKYDKMPLVFQGMRIGHNLVTPFIVYG
jgi:hypothetical protein